MPKTNFISTIQKQSQTYQAQTSQEKLLGTTKQKHHGIFYTNYKIAYKITEEAFTNFDKEINNTLFFEPSAGLGVFVMTYLDYIHKNLKNYNLEKIINNIFLSEVDEKAIILAQALITEFIKTKFGKDLSIPKENIHMGDTLIDEDFNIKSTKDLFARDIKFDFILSNPPYRNVKASKKELVGVEYDNYRSYCSNFSKSIKKSLSYQQGGINLYKVFFELILEHYSADDASIGIIVPSSLLSDKSTLSFRKALLQNSNLKKIYYLEEKSTQFKEITQAMCFFGFQKVQNTKEQIELINFDDKSKRFTIRPNDLSKIDSNYSFNKIDKTSNELLSKIHKFPKLKDIDSIRNLRGELDLTADKKYMTNEVTPYMLLQGKNIKEWSYTQNDIFVKENFTSSRTSPKFNDIKNERIICQQISNMSGNKRMKFTKIPKDMILGNSCNYIVSDTLSTNHLLGLFNSYLFDWRFQLFSSNNHINNYELDDLPMNILDKKDKIEKLTEEILKGNQQSHIALNLLVFSIYKLTTKEITHVMKNYNDEIAFLIVEEVESYE